MLYLCLIILLINNTHQAVDKVLKKKAKMCLVLFRIRQHQDPKTIEAILSHLSSIDNAKEKVSMFAITHCYSTITIEQADAIQNLLDEGTTVNSLSEDNLLLLSLEQMGKVNFDTFSDSIQEFFEVFNELMNDSKKEQNSQQERNEPEEDDIPFYKSNSFIIIVSIFIVNICFVMYQCLKNKKSKNDEDDEDDNTQNKDSNDKKDESSSSKKKKE